MQPHDIILIFVIKTVLCQINGEFWWMHEKVAQLQNIEPPQPKIEDLDEFETDESVKVVFKDDERYSDDIPDYNKNKENQIIRNRILPVVVFRDHNELLKPDHLQREITHNKDKRKENITINHDTNNSLSINLIKDTLSSVPVAKSNGDKFEFIFPGNTEHLWEKKIKNNTKVIDDFNSNNKTGKPSTIILSDKILFEEDKTQPQAESICTFITTYNCLRKNGIVHMPGLCPKNSLSDSRKICCILPLTSNSSSNIQNINFKSNRTKRSNPSEKFNSPLQQRDNLLLRQYNYQMPQPKLTTSTARSRPNPKIVTPGDYGDPYWNIKNSKFRTPSFQSTMNQDYQNTRYDDYIDDYDVELPRPGLVGIYSDHKDKQSNWKLEASKKFTYGGIHEDSEEDNSGVGFGYSTIDPRLGDRKSKPLRRKPQRLTTSSTDEDKVQISESQTIHFHSTPDFHVLEGFKLLNLVGDNNRNIRRRTTGNIYSDEDTSIEHTSPVTANLDHDDDIDIIDQQVFNTCGRTRIKSREPSIGRSSVEMNCDPWIAIVVHTKNPQSILCYATIIHPRAAVTAANCIQGKSPGQISTIAGIWNLNDRSKAQHRMASVFVHPQFRREDLANDYGLLHWKRPLRLQSNVQPACLAEPHVDDDCYFAGWGGFDQVLQQQPQSQHASILTLRSCNEKISAPDVQIPAGAFCASVDTVGTVTGVGGPLLCKNGDRVSIVGVAVYREDVIVLLPAYDWVTRAIRELNL